MNLEVYPDQDKPSRFPQPTSDWRWFMRTAIRDAETLLRRLGLPAEPSADTAAAQTQFPVFVPEPFLRRMQWGERNDPLLRQVLPVPEESRPHPGYVEDPVGDLQHQMQPGVIHKYPGRVLLLPTGACAIHCRYCFRRHFPYSDAPSGSVQWQAAIDQLGKCDGMEIEEVILSGGDPLTLTDQQLTLLLSQIQSLPNVRTIRIHSRLPVVIPQRVTKRLLAMLHACTRQVVLVLHVNHPREIDDQFKSACQQLQGNCLLLNQAVLLDGVNDNVTALLELSHGLIQCGVLPYYLHHLDPVQGAAHFQVPRERGSQLIQQLRQRLPGYAVPRYVVDEPGQLSKTWIG